MCACERERQREREVPGVGVGVYVCVCGRGVGVEGGGAECAGDFRREGDGNFIDTSSLITTLRLPMIGKPFWLFH